MNISELFSKATRRFERADVEDILETAYTASDLSMQKLSSIITKGTTKVTKVNNTDVKRLLYVIVPYSIIKYDIKHAMELAGIDNEELFMIKVVREATSEPEKIQKFKDGIFGDGKHGVYYQGKGDKQYAILNSSELFPNSDRFKDQGTYNHEFIVNLSGADYMLGAIQLYESFCKDGIPFNMVIRLPQDMKDGYPDPIRLYATDKNLQATIDELERMTYVLKNRLQSPDWRICASIDGLYGYTQIDVNNQSKTPMDEIFETITKVVDQYLTDYDFNHGATEKIEYNWKIRTVKLLRMKAMDSDAYEELIDDIMKHIEELGLDLNDIYKAPSANGLDKNIKELDAMLSTIDKMAEEMPVVNKEVMPEHEVEVEDELPPVGPIDEYVDDNVQSIAFHGPQTGSVTHGEEVEPKKVELVSSVNLSYSDLANVLNNVRLQAEAREEKNTENGVIQNPELVSKALDVLEQAREIAQQEEQPVEEQPVEEPITEEVKEEPKGDGFVEVWEEAQKEKDKLEETQAYVPLTEEQINDTEPKVVTPPVMPDVEPVSSDLLKTIEEEANDEDEIVSTNTGSYSAIPVEVTGFDNDEVKSIVDAPQAGQTNSMEETSVALNEYQGVLTVKEALMDVINSNGETVSLIDYLKNENVSTKIPFDSTVVLNDGSELSGVDFIRTYVIPVVTANTTEQIFTVDQVINNYSTDIRVNAPEKKQGFFARLFGGKKK